MDSTPRKRRIETIQSAFSPEGQKIEYTMQSSKFSPSQTYTVSIEDVVLKPGAITYNSMLDKEILGKEFDTLTSDQKNQVFAVDGPTWQDGKPKPRTSDVWEIILVEESTGQRFFYDSTVQFNFWNESIVNPQTLERELLPGKPTKEFYKFVTRVTGKVIEEDTKWKMSDIFQKGMKFSTKIGSNKKGFPKIVKDSVMPLGVVSEGSGESVIQAPPLNDNEKLLYEMVIQKKEFLNGKEKGVLFDKLQMWKDSGELPGTVTTNDWIKVRNAHPELFGADGKFAIP